MAKFQCSVEVFGCRIAGEKTFVGVNFLSLNPRGKGVGGWLDEVAPLRPTAWNKHEELGFNWLGLLSCATSPTKRLF